MVSDPQLLVEVSDCNIAKLLTIVKDKNPRDLKVANDAFPNEVSDILLGNGSQGFYFYPFCEVIDSYDEELELLYRHRERSHDVKSLLSEGPQSVHRSKLFQRLSYNVTEVLALVTHLHIRLGVLLHGRLIVSCLYELVNPVTMPSNGFHILPRPRELPL